MNLRIIFKFNDCKLQFYEKRGFFSYFSVNPRKPAGRWLAGFFFTPPPFLATKVAISFVYYSPKAIKCTQKPKIEKKFIGIDQSSERASELVPFPTSYLQLALAHARKSRVKNDKRKRSPISFTNCKEKRKYNLSFIFLYNWKSVGTKVHGLFILK